MRRQLTLAKPALILFAVLSGWPHAQARNASERWDGVIVFGSLKAPFSMQIDFDGASVSAVFTSGEDRVESTSGTLSGDAVLIKFDSLGTVLEAVQNGGSMKGTYTKAADPQKRLAIELNRFCTCGFVGEAGPDISGVWSIDGGGRLAVERKGDDTFATVRLAGDDRQFGTLSGRFDGVSFSLSHFTGSNAALLDAEPRKDGKLDLNLQLPDEAPRKVVASRIQP
jgi:hypothetical protein